MTQSDIIRDSKFNPAIFPIFYSKMPRINEADNYESTADKFAITLFNVLKSEGMKYNFDEFIEFFGKSNSDVWDRFWHYYRYDAEGKQFVFNTFVDDENSPYKIANEICCNIGLDAWTEWTPEFQGMCIAYLRYYGMSELDDLMEFIGEGNDIEETIEVFFDCWEDDEALGEHWAKYCGYEDYLEEKIDRNENIWNYVTLDYDMIGVDARIENKCIYNKWFFAQPITEGVSGWYFFN